jgi:hypothetical protein
VIISRKTEDGKICSTHGDKECTKFQSENFKGRYLGILYTGGRITVKCILIRNGPNRHGLDSTGTRERAMVGSCEHGNLGFYQLSNYQVFKKESESFVIN